MQRMAKYLACLIADFLVITGREMLRCALHDNGFQTRKDEPTGSSFLVCSA
jgi:hypothetical protein